MGNFKIKFLVPVEEEGVGVSLLLFTLAIEMASWAGLAEMFVLAAVWWVELGKGEGGRWPKKEMSGKLVVSVTWGSSSSFTAVVLPTALDFNISGFWQIRFQVSFKTQSDTSGSEPGNCSCLGQV